MVEPTRSSLSIVIPVLDEADNAVPLVRGILDVVRPLDVSFELIVVDDGSQDGTHQVFCGMLAETPELVVIRLRRTFGQTPALQAGFDRARGDVIVTLDGDLQSDPRDIQR